MAYPKTLLTVPAITLKVENNTSLGFTGYFVKAYNTVTGVAFTGKCDLHTNLSSEWEQLKDILQYCGIVLADEAAVQNWYKAQTQVSFINAVRKYFVEVFFPKLATFVNGFITSGAVPASTSATTLLSGWHGLLGAVDVVYNLDGTIKEFTI